MDAYPLKMVSNTRVSFFIKKIYIVNILMYYRYLLFKRIQDSYFYTAHFYKAKNNLDFINVKLINIVLIYIYHHLSFIEN